MKKRIIAMMLGICLALGTLTGCESNLKKAIDASREAENLPEVDYAQWYDEEHGYHYPGTYWGMTLTQLREVFPTEINDYSTYTSNGDAVYSANRIGRKVGGRTANMTDIAVDAEQKLYMVTMGFNGDEIKTGEPSQSQVVTLIRDGLIAAFGEPNEELKEDTTLSDNQAVLTTWKWVKVLEDGTRTEIQLAQALVGYSTEPTYVSFGVIGSDKARQEAATAEAETTLAQ